MPDMNENAETQQEYFGKVNIKQNDFKTSYYNLLSKYADLEKQLTEKDKQIEELKSLKDVATLIRANNDTVVTLMQLNNMLVGKNQQLTKAKEIIRTFLGFAEAFGYSPSMDKFITEAEQFLSEVEKCGQ